MRLYIIMIPLSVLLSTCSRGRLSVSDTEKLIRDAHPGIHAATEVYAQEKGLPVTRRKLSPLFQVHLTPEHLKAVSQYRGPNQIIGMYDEAHDVIHLTPQSDKHTTLELLAHEIAHRMLGESEHVADDFADWYMQRGEK